MTQAWPEPKDPDEVLDYDLDWSGRLDTGDTISTSTWTVPSGLTKDSESASSTVAKVWLSGGTDGESYTLMNRITTAGGRTMDWSIRLKIRSK